MVTVHSVFRFLRTCNFCFKCIYVYTKRSSYFKVSCILYHIFIICKQKLFTTVLFPSCNNHFPCSLICIISRIARRLSSKSFPSSSMVISAYFSYRGTRSSYRSFRLLPSFNRTPRPFRFPSLLDKDSSDNLRYIT